jgi:GATA-binding protein
MSGATTQYEERGGILRSVHAPFDTTMIADAEASQNLTASTSTSITEHDFRFPRRPEQHPEQQHDDDPNSNPTFPNPELSNKFTGANALDNLDFSSASSASARKDLLRESFFPSWKDDAAGEELDSPDEMQRKDPLATQIWRLYSKTKKQLPNQERMENLTWRMMAMSLRKRKQQEEVARYVLDDVHSQTSLLTPHYRLKQAPTSTPSGIAQLRKSSDQQIGQSAESSEAMNLDDYIFADNISTPLAFGNSPSPELNKKDADTTNHAVASAIPIKMRKESSQFAVPQSVPVPHHIPRHNEEFNYVQRHVRKTSIDERRVSITVFVAWFIL